MRSPHVAAALLTGAVALSSLTLGGCGLSPEFDPFAGISSTRVVFDDEQHAGNAAAPAEFFSLAHQPVAVDGSTIDIVDDAENTHTVHLIGIETPQLHTGDGDPEPYAAPAAALIEDLLAGREDIWLEFDDDLGRQRDDGDLQAYVWTRHSDTGDPEQMLNLAQIEAGHAKALEQEHRHLDQFLQVQGHAQADRVGLWSDYTAEDLRVNV